VGEGEGRRERQWRRRREVREEDGDGGRHMEVRDSGWFERRREKHPDIPGMCGGGGGSSFCKL
jgi:hypothetical protein